MKRIAIIGAGPTGIYTFFSLLNQRTPLCITVYEQTEKAGVGMPYSDEDNSRLMLAIIARIEIPPIFSTYIDWLRSQDDAHQSAQVHAGWRHNPSRVAYWAVARSIWIRVAS